MTDAPHTCMYSNVARCEACDPDDDDVLSREKTDLKHECVVCRRHDIRLYRPYGSFLRDNEIVCRAHAEAGAIERKALVPLCEDSDGSVWGYTSVPPDAIARWYALREAT